VKCETPFIRIDLTSLPQNSPSDKSESLSLFHFQINKDENENLGVQEGMNAVFCQESQIASRLP